MALPGKDWQRFGFDIPESWKGKDLRLVATDQATGWMDWLAFSSPLTPERNGLIRAARKILLKTPLFAILIFLPGCTLAAFALSKGIRGTVNLGLITLAGIALPGYLTFFLYVLSARAAHFASVITPLLAGASLLFLLKQLAPEERSQLKILLLPLG